MGAEKTKIGFIGCGRAAQTVHLPYFAASEQCQIKTLVDKRIVLASELAARYGIPQVDEDYHVLCDDPEIEAVVMILRETLHAPVAIELLRAGKHVFTEKPLSNRLGEGRRLAAAAEETGQLLMVGYMRRYDAGIEMARQLMGEARSSGSLGQVVQAHLKTHGGRRTPFHYGDTEPVTSAEEKPPMPPGAADEIPESVHDLAWATNFFDAHLTDMMLYLLDPVRQVVFADMHLEPPSRLFIYDHGPYKTTHAAGANDAGPRDESMTVWFERGRLTIRPASNFLRDVHAQVEVVRGSGTSPALERPVIQGPWCFQAQAEDFLHCVRTGCQPRCTAADAMRNVELVHATSRKLAGLE